MRRRPDEVATPPQVLRDFGMWLDVVGVDAGDAAVWDAQLEVWRSERSAWAARHGRCERDLEWRLPDGPFNVRLI